MRALLLIFAPTDDTHTHIRAHTQGTDETYAADIARFVGHVVEAGGTVEVLQGTDMFHDYATVSPRLFRTAEVGVAQKAVGGWLGALCAS